MSEYKTEDFTPVVSRAREKRRMCFVIWNFEIPEYDAFCHTVDAAKEKGFTTIRLHLSWFNAEKSPLRYEFAPYDREIDYIRSRGMDVLLTVDLQRKTHIFDGVRVCTDTVVTTDEFQHAYGKKTPFLGEEGERDTLMISYASRRGTELAVRFFRDAVRHFTARFGNTIYAVSPTFTPFCETEYWCTDDFDYSVHMLRAYRAFLAETYKKIADLNADLGTDYTDFSEVVPPRLTERNDAALLFYQCRHRVLRDFITRLAEAAKSASPDTLFSVQFGCVWDNASARRCTYGFRDLAGAADLVVVDDAPKFDHAFSMDYVASALSDTGKKFGNEIDGYYMIDNGVCTSEDYIEQGLTSFRHNADVLYVANWSADAHFEDNGYIFTTIADEYLPGNAPYCVSEDPAEEQPVAVSLYKLFTTGDGNYYTGYYQLFTDHGASFGRLNIKDDLTARALPHSIAGKKAKREKEPEDPASPAVIFRRKAKAAVLATAAVGAAILIFSSAAAAFIIKTTENGGN